MAKHQDKVKEIDGTQVEYVSRKAQPNALLTFVGEQDATAFSIVCKAVEEQLGQEESGGSRELSVRAEDGRIIVGYKKEINV
jgi:hypothetical protein